MDLLCEAIVFANGYVVIESSTDAREFWIELGPEVGWGRFQRLAGSVINRDEVPFVLREVRPAHAPVPSPVVSSLGVLWRRRAAIAAHQRIEAYRRQEGRIP